jgi:CDP-diacylglycerol--glycerol-3-phosphate 3-phosphatidyltransferase
MGRSGLPEENSVPGLQAFRKALALFVTGPVVRLLSKTPITPNALTICSLVITFIAAVLVGLKYFIAAALVMLFASLFDILDGALARGTNQVTKFGAALDSSLDRLAEAVIFIALMVVYTGDQSMIGVVLAGTALVCSFMVSYVRARAEGLGVDCQVGIFTRAERIAVLVIGLLLGQFSWPITVALVVIIVLSSITVGQRLYQIWKKTRT